MMDDVVVQGLLGRATGYDDNGDSIVFSDIDSVNRYLELFDSKFSEKCPWKSNSTKTAKFSTGVVSKGTFNGKVSDEETTVNMTPPVKEFRGPGHNGYDNPEDLIKDMKLHLKSTDYKHCISARACTPISDGAYYISSTISGSKKLKEDPNERLLLEKYNKMSQNCCISKSARCWLICPVYIDSTSKPEEVRWFGRCLE